jgi:hypothetical protein
MDDRGARVGPRAYREQVRDTAARTIRVGESSGAKGGRWVAILVLGFGLLAWLAFLSATLTQAGSRHAASPTPAPENPTERLVEQVHTAWGSDWAATIESLEALDRLDPRGEWRGKLYAAYVNDASALIDRQSWDAARERLGQAIALDPQRPEARIQAARLPAPTAPAAH